MNVYSFDVFLDICQLCSCHADSFTEKTIDCRSKRLVEMPHFRTRYTDGTIRR